MQQSSLSRKIPKEYHGKGAAHAATRAVLVAAAGTPAQGAYEAAEMRHNHWCCHAPSQLHGTVRVHRLPELMVDENGPIAAALGNYGWVWLGEEISIL
jgi:hypothetical protein